MREERKRAPQAQITFLLQSFDSGVNVGHMFRLADACGARELILTGKTPRPPHPDISITSIEQDKTVPFRYFPHAEEAVKVLKEEGYAIVSIELVEGAVRYTDFQYPKKVCFVLGNEMTGVFPSVLTASDACVYIPVFGRNFSLNVHVSAAIVAFWMKSLPS